MTSQRVWTRPQDAGRSGFSLLELLVVIGVVAVLLGLSVPALRSARMRAQAGVCLTQQRSNAIAVMIYTGDNRDTWPCVLKDGLIEPYTGQRLRSGSPYEVYGYSWAGDYWHATMLEDYFGGDPFCAALYCAASRMRQSALEEHRSSDRPWSTGVAMSMAMYLHPEALNPEAPRWRREYFRVMRTSDVVTPMAKAMLYEAGPWHDASLRSGGGVIVPSPPWKLPVIACDASGAMRDHRQSVEGVVFSETPDGEHKHADGLSDTYRYTPWGVRGRDW